MGTPSARALHIFGLVTNEIAVGSPWRSSKEHAQLSRDSDSTYTWNTLHTSGTAQSDGDARWRGVGRAPGLPWTSGLTLDAIITVRVPWRHDAQIAMSGLARHEARG